MKPSRSTWIIAIVAAVVIVAGLVWSQSKRTLRLTALQVQAELDKKFPVEKNESVYRIQYFEPAFSIDQVRNDVTLALSVEASALGSQPVRVRAVATGLVRYDAEKGDLFLDNPKVSISSGPGEGALKNVAEGLLANAVEEYLERLPLYHLKESDSSRRKLKSVRVADGLLVIEFAL
jgi:Protein of unknown function (DUF1439)